MKLKESISYLLLLCFALSSTIFAADSTQKSTKVVKKHQTKHSYKDHRYKDTLYHHNHFEAIGALGRSNLQAGNSEIGVTSSESDRLVQTNTHSWEAIAGQLGAGYLYYFKNPPRSGSVQWFPAIEPQLNLYQISSNSIKGDVWRFDNPNFIQSTFDIPVHSTRVMLDAALTVATWKQLSVYAKAGIGHGWTRVSYSDASNGQGDCANYQSLSLSSNTTSHFVWEAGAGAVLAVSPRVGISLEYLYADLGNVKLATSGNTGLITSPVLSASSFKIKSQTGLLGLHIAI